MTAPASTFAEYVERLTLEPGGLRFELEPWQRQLLEDLEHGRRPLGRGELELASRRSFRRYRAALALAAAALGGHDVTIAASPGDSQALTEDLATMAGRVLWDYGQATGADVELARRRLARMPRPARTFAQVDETHTHTPAELAELRRRLPRS